MTLSPQFEIGSVDVYRRSCKDWSAGDTLSEMGLLGWTALNVVIHLPTQDAQVDTFARILKNAVLLDPQCIHNPKDRFMVELTMRLMRTTPSMSQKTNQSVTQIKQKLQALDASREKNSQQLFREEVLHHPEHFPTADHFKLCGANNIAQVRKNGIHRFKQRTLYQLMALKNHNEDEHLPLLEWGKSVGYLPAWDQIQNHPQASHFNQELLNNYHTYPLSFAKFKDGVQFDRYLETCQESIERRDQYLESVLRFFNQVESPIFDNVDDPEIHNRCAHLIQKNWQDFDDLIAKGYLDDLLIDVFVHWSETDIRSAQQTIEIIQSKRVEDFPPNLTAIIEKIELQSCAPLQQAGSFSSRKRL